LLAEQKAEEKIQNSITISEVYKIINDTLKQNTKLLNGFIIPDISINKKIEISTRYNHSFYDGTTSNKNQTNQTKEQKEQIEKKEYAHIQIPNNVIRDFFNSGGEQKNSNGIKIDITIDRIYINTRGILNIIPSKIKEAGLSNREIKNRNLKKYIEQNYKDREKRELPKLITSIYAITSSNSNIDKDINEIAIIKDVVIQKAKTEKEIKSLALSKEAQSKDLIVFFRGGHEDENMEMFSTIETIDAIAQSTKPIVVALGHRDDRPFIEIFADKIFATPSEFAKAIADMLFNTINQKNNTITQIKKNLMSIISS